jgi:hypothetical protein
MVIPVCRAMNEAFDIGSRCQLLLRGLSERDRAAIGQALDPCPPVRTPSRPTLVIEVDESVPGTLQDIQHNARDGRVTASDDHRFYVLERGRACSVPPLDGEPPRTFALEPGFPIVRSFGQLVRPALQVMMPALGCVAVHSGAVAIEGRSVLVAGWSESGKTETALALLESGARFISDKWTILDRDGTASVFPIGVGVRGWVLRYLPRLKNAFEAKGRGRLRTAALMRAATRPLAWGPARGVLERAVTLADRVAVTPSELRRLYGEEASAPWSAPLGAVALLRTVPPGAGVRVEPADPAWAASRLALTAAFERRAIFDLHERAQWSASAPDLDLRHRAVERERELITSVLSAVPVLDVRAPFPTDPRTVAEAITRRL